MSDRLLRLAFGAALIAVLGLARTVGRHPEQWAVGIVVGGLLVGGLVRGCG